MGDRVQCHLTTCHDEAEPVALRVTYRLGYPQPDGPERTEDFGPYCALHLGIVGASMVHSTTNNNRNDVRIVDIDEAHIRSARST